MLSKSLQRGVTLIEIMIGLVIIAILFGLAANNYSDWIQNQQIRTAAMSIENGLQTARGEAVKLNGSVRFTLCDVANGLVTSSWEVLAASAVAVPAASVACAKSTAVNPGEILVQERSGQEGSRMAQVATNAAVPAVVASPIAADGSSTVTFNSYGRVVANINGGAASIAVIEITTPTGTRPLWIEIGTGGNIRMCDPSPLLPANDPRRC
jgi:type IV fimbrial biogenesis protein FimT